MVNLSWWPLCGLSLETGTKIVIFVTLLFSIAGGMFFVKGFGCLTVLEISAFICVIHLILVSIIGLFGAHFKKHLLLGPYFIVGSMGCMLSGYAVVVSLFKKEKILKGHLFHRFSKEYAHLEHFYYWIVIVTGFIYTVFQCYACFIIYYHYQELAKKKRHSSALKE